MGEDKKYQGIYGLKACSILLIILMHVYVNGSYEINSYVFHAIIKKLSVFIELFFIASAFGMCCGYYEKIKRGNIDFNAFYTRRYQKILPFFSIIVLAELIFNGLNGKTITEAFLDITLIFGFLPNGNIEVVGIGWTLGVIFAFYMLFPFFVFLLWNKKRAWISLVIAIIIRFAAPAYLGFEGNIINCNILVWAYYFVAGGIVYLYKDRLVKIFKNRNVVLLIVIVMLFALENVLYINGFGFIAGRLISVMFVVMLVYAISEKGRFLGSAILKFIGNYCLEIYLSHMMIFRLLEKLHFTNIFDNSVLSCVTTYIFTVIGTLCFSIVASKIITGIQKRITDRLHLIQSNKIK